MPAPLLTCELTREGRLRLLPPVPPAMLARFPALATPAVDIVGLFPFVAHFAEEAESVWRGSEPASLRSEPWDEVDADGEPCTLEATAVRTEHDRTLLIGLADSAAVPIRDILQAARDRTEQVVETNRLLRRLAERLTLAEERERRRIADGLHDHIGQALAVAKMHLGMLLDDVQPDLRERIGFVRSLIEDSVDHTRTLTFELAPPALHELGLVAALESLAADARRRYGLAAACHDDGSDKPVPEATRTILFLAARELVHNVAKHADARSVRIHVRQHDGQIHVEVEDDGVGFVVGDGGSRQIGGGYGLLNVRERVEHLGGEVVIASRPGQGTRVVVSAPLDAAPIQEPA